ncbi:MAG: glycosyltransferase [Calditrichaeota bacterium]|nr:MAG: glycosyltransferase [Calditrichota bacterium]
MKIAYVHTGLWPSNSPSLTFASLTAHALALEGQSCHFYIRCNSDLTGVEVFQKYFNLQIPANLFIHQGAPKGTLNTNRLYFHWVYKNLLRLIEAGEIDVVISRNPTFLPWLAKLKKKFQIQTWFESHDFFADPSVRTDLKKPRKKQMHLERKYIPRISGVICLQNSQIELYQRCFPKSRIILARTGVLSVRKKVAADANCVGYIGSLDWHKGVDILIEAASRSASRPHVLIIGGKNQLEIDDFLAKIKPEFRERIEITGWLKREELEQEMQKMRVGIVPLRDTFFNRYLTSPLKIFDFFAAGIPVIAPDFPTMRELIDANKTGLIFEPGNPTSLAEKIDLIFGNQNKHAAMNEAVMAKAGTLLWSERAKVLLKNFKKVADEE